MIYFKDIHIFVIINNRLTTFHDDSFTPYTKKNAIYKNAPYTKKNAATLNELRRSLYV